MKKIIALFCAVVLVLSLSGCKDTSKQADKSETNKDFEYSTEFDGDYYVLRNGLTNTYRKIKNKKDISIAFMGGSITYGIGTNDLNDSFRVLVEEWFKEQYGISVNQQNLAIPSAASGLGAYCVEADVLLYNPDIVFIEYAINDKYARAQYSQEEISVNMETIIRKIRTNSPNTDIVLLYTTAAEVSMSEALFMEAKVHEEIAAHYGVTSINIGYGLRKSRGLLKSGSSAVDQKWLQFFADSCHTNRNGNIVYANIIKECIQSAFKAAESGAKVNLQLPKTKNKTLLNTEYIKTSDVSLDGNKGWKKSTEQWNVFTQYSDGYIFTDTKENELKFTFSGTSFGVVGPINRNFSYSLDGQEWVEYEKFNSHPQPIVEGLENKQHTIKIKVPDADVETFSVAAFLVGK